MPAPLPKQAIVLVGGRGTRLGSVSNFIPKPLMPIREDQRFLDVLLRNIAWHGVEEIVLMAGHLGEQVAMRYSGSSIGTTRIEVVVESAPSGTGGALTHAAERLESRFLVMNGDSIFDFDYKRLMDAWRPGDIATIAVRDVNDGSRYGTVDVREGRVHAFIEKDPTRVGPATISGGVYFLSRGVLDRIKSLPCSIEVELFPSFATEGVMGAVKVDGYFLDIGLPHTLEQARCELLDAVRRPATVIRASEPMDLIVAANMIARARSEGRYVFVQFDYAPDDVKMAAVLKRLRQRRIHVDMIVVGGDKELGRAIRQYDTQTV